VTVETIDDDGNALASGVDGPSEQTIGWALLNLLAALLTVAIALVRMSGLLGNAEDQQYSEDDKRRNTMRLLALVPAICAVAAFLITQNLSGQMGMFDKWTWLMVALLVAQVAMALPAILAKSEA
jgi:cytochrome bd-type quinol oxidase subunit 2